MTHKLTQENFETIIADGVTVVDFWAEWCGPCRTLNPILEDLSEQYKNVKIGKVNVDENQDLAFKYDVRSIPTIIFFKNGKPVDKQVGLSTLNNLSEKLNIYL